MKIFKTIIVLLFLCDNQALAQAAQSIAFNDINISVKSTDETLDLYTGSPITDRSLHPDSLLMILSTGLYALPPDKPSMGILMIRERLDPKWQFVKESIESLKVEEEAYNSSVEMALAYQLALTLSLDASPQTALEHLLNKQAQINSSTDSSWFFNHQNKEHLVRVKSMLKKMSNAIELSKLQVAGNTNRLYLGFTPDSSPEPVLYWPKNVNEPLCLAHRQVSSPYCKESIGQRLLTGKPKWFEPPKDFNTTTELVSCLPLGGCGYLPKSAVSAVLPLWAVFDRATLSLISLSIPTN